MQKELTKTEFDSFAKALVLWQKGEPFDQFFKEAFIIFGAERKYLIKGKILTLRAPQILAKS